MARFGTLLIALLFAWPVAAADVAGEVIRLRGVAVASAGEEARQLQNGDDVFVGETITTSGATRLRIRLIEGAIITLGDNSTFTLVGYEEESDGPLLDFTRGVFLGVSSKVEAIRKGLTVRTPLGSTGVRGTTFWGGIEAETLSVALLEGSGVWVEAQGVRVELTRPNDGVTVRAGQPPTKPKAWGAPKLNAAKGSVAFD